MYDTVKSLAFLSCADDSHVVYFDGKQFNNNSKVGDWNQTIATPIPSNTQVIAVAVTNNAGTAGWRGALSDGNAVTDGSWRCTSTYADGWQNVDFDDSSWPVPYMTQTSLGCVGYPSAAQWLWTEKSYTATMTVYCRKRLGKFFFSHVIVRRLHIKIKK